VLHYVFVITCSLVYVCWCAWCGGARSCVDISWCEGGIESNKVFDERKEAIAPSVPCRKHRIFQLLAVMPKGKGHKRSGGEGGTGKKRPRAKTHEAADTGHTLLSSSPSETGALQTPPRKTTTGHPRGLRNPITSPFVGVYNTKRVLVDYMQDNSDDDVDEHDEEELQDLYRLAQRIQREAKLGSPDPLFYRGPSPDELFHNIDGLAPDDGVKLRPLKTAYAGAYKTLEKIEQKLGRVGPCKVEDAGKRHRVIVDQRKVYIQKVRTDQFDELADGPADTERTSDKTSHKQIELVAYKSGKRGVRPILPIKDLQIGVFTIKNIPLDIEIVRDDIKPHLLFTVSYPEKIDTMTYSKAFRPSMQTLILVAVVYFYLCVFVSWWWLVFFPPPAYYVYNLFQAQSPFAPAEGIAQFLIYVEDVTGWSHSARLTEHEFVAIEASKVTRTWRKKLDAPDGSPQGRKLSPKGQTGKRRAGSIGKVSSTGNIVGMESTGGLRQRKFSKSISTSNLPAATGGSADVRTPAARSSVMHSQMKTEAKRRSSHFDLTKEEHRQDAKVEEIKNAVLQFRFKEPLLHPLLQDFVACHEKLIPLVEDGLPSWALFLAGYGLYYRPWMRRVFDIVMWLASVGMMLLALYDLFKTFPMVRNFAMNLFGTWFSAVDKIMDYFRVFFLSIIFPLNPFIGLVRGLGNAVVLSIRVPLQFITAILTGIMGFVRGVCSCCTRPNAAIQVAKAGSRLQPSSFMKPFKFFFATCQWGWSIFRNIFLVGLGKMGTWLTSHTQTILRFYVYPYRDRLVAYAVGLLIVIVIISILL
jgi:hypothetical protein